MRLRGLTIEPGVLLAPMAGITDSPFRALARRLGCPAVVSEMLSAEGLVRGTRGTRKLLFHQPVEHPILAQIFGRDPDRLAEAARVCAAAGFDGVDINMGCPVPKVVRNGAGAALMRDPVRAEAVVRAVRRSIELPLTVKLRAGWSETERNALELAPRLVAAGADAICLHPRTRAQFYAGRADWSLIGRLVELLEVPVIGNGDLRTPADAARLQAQTGCRAVMVGRAALGDPWLPAALAGAPYPPAPAERLRVFCTHLDEMIAFVGSEARAVLRMRKHLVWYTRGLHGAARVRRELEHFHTASQMRDAFRQLLAENDAAAALQTA